MLPPFARRRTGAPLFGGVATIARNWLQKDAFRFTNAKYTEQEPLGIHGGVHGERRTSS